MSLSSAALRLCERIALPARHLALSAGVLSGCGWSAGESVDAGFAGEAAGGSFLIFWPDGSCCSGVIDSFLSEAGWAGMYEKQVHSYGRRSTLMFLISLRVNPGRVVVIVV